VNINKVSEPSWQDVFSKTSEVLNQLLETRSFWKDLRGFESALETRSFWKDLRGFESAFENPEFLKTSEVSGKRKTSEVLNQLLKTRSF